MVGAGVPARPRGASGGSCVSASASEPAEGGFFNAEKRRNGEREPWPKAKLGEVFRFVDYRGKTPTKIGAGVPLITARNIRQGYLDYSERFFISKEEYLTRQTRGIAHKGDILFTTEAPMGFVAIADLDEFSTGQRIITFQWPDENIEHENRFFLYYFLSDHFQRQLKENASGATAQGIKASRLVNLTVPLPPLAVQRSIVSRLEAAAGRRARIVALADEGAAATADLRKAILKEAFEPT